MAKTKSRTGALMKGLFAILFGVLLVAQVGCGKKEEAAVHSRDAGKLALTVMDVHDQTHDLRQHLGKVVIIDFWDTWCGPCKREIPHFVELYDEYRDDGLEIVGVAFGRHGKDKVRAFGEQYKINYTNAIFNEEAGAMFGRPRSIPTTFIIDRNGQIAEKVTGFRPKEYFETRIRALLEAS